MGLGLQPLSEEGRFLHDLDLMGHTVFDVGAFEGSHTIFFAHRVGPNGRVVAFEPDAENHEKTLTNVLMKGFANVDVRNLGLGRRRETLLFGFPDDRSLGSAEPAIRDKLLGERGARPVSIEIRPLDEEIATAGLLDPDFVKIDVEGLELAVLEGMAETVARCRPALFVEIHGVGRVQKEENSLRVLRWLREQGYVVTHVESRRPVTPSTSALAREGHVYCSPR